MALPNLKLRFKFNFSHLLIQWLNNLHINVGTIGITDQSKRIVPSC